MRSELKTRLKSGIIFALALSVVFSVSITVKDTGAPESVNIEPTAIYPTSTPTPTNTPTPSPTITPAWIEQSKTDQEEALEGFYATSTLLEIEPLGKYYITAYSPQETGSWITASGIKLHRASYENRYTEPTTCAVDPKLHKIGKNGVKFYIPEFDRVFIAQDTGSAVRGKHLDLAYTDLRSVKRFPTGKYQTFKVISVTETNYSREDINYTFTTW